MRVSDRVTDRETGDPVVKATAAVAETWMFADQIGRYAIKARAGTTTVTVRADGNVSE
jgi:hypothetical protein